MLQDWHVRAVFDRWSPSNQPGRVCMRRVPSCPRNRDGALSICRPAKGPTHLHPRPWRFRSCSEQTPAPHRQSRGQKPRRALPPLARTLRFSSCCTTYSTSLAICTGKNSNAPASVVCPINARAASDSAWSAQNESTHTLASKCKRPAPGRHRCRLGAGQITWANTSANAGTLLSCPSCRRLSSRCAAVMTSAE